MGHLALLPRPLPRFLALHQPAVDEIGDQPLDVELRVEQLGALQAGVELAEEEGLLVVILSSPVGSRWSS